MFGGTIYILFYNTLKVLLYYLGNDYIETVDVAIMIILKGKLPW